MPEHDRGSEHYESSHNGDRLARDGDSRQWQLWSRNPYGPGFCGIRTIVRHHRRSLGKSLGMARPGKLRYIRPGAQEHPNFLAVFRVLVILIEALANFGRGDTNNGIGIRVVGGWSLKDLNPEDALFKFVRLTVQNTPDHKSQELGISLA